MPTLSISPEPRRRTRRRYAILVLLVLAAIGGWTGLWIYAANRAEQAIADWRVHEAAAGRDVACGSQRIAGYPFRIEISCRPASAEFHTLQPALKLDLPHILAAVQIYQPDLMISEFQGPVRVGEAGKPPLFEANWSLGQASVRGLPSPERVSLVFDRPLIERLGDGARETLLTAGHVELHGRPAAPDEAGKPGIETGIRVQQAALPGVHEALAKPIDAVVDAILRGVSDFEPKPWRVRLRELQAAGGGIEIKQARVQQGDTLAVGNGSLTINASGRLDGELRVTVVGLDRFLHEIGADRMLQKSATMDKVAGALDRLMPGLGNVAREQVGANLGAGISALGQPATLEGKPAISLPVRFDDGAVFFGPLPVGRMPPLL